MKKIYLIGIGTGNPEHLTVEAINILKKVNIFFILEKESEKNEELIKIRKEILEKYLPYGYRFIIVKIPERKRGGRELEAYKDRVELWRKQKAEIISNLIEHELADNEIGAILIWGDPSLYDGHIEILQYIKNNKMATFEFEVIPGITSIQVLTSRHKIPLNSIAEKILITTGRRLREISPNDIENAVVLLDNYRTYKNFVESDLNIYWGAYLGTDDEVLISGPLREVLDSIIETRERLKRQKGWIMETYLLRRNISKDRRNLDS